MLLVCIIPKGIAMARLRTSSHSLAKEVGRFHKPRPLPVTDRLCTVCDIIEDEYHFLCVCVHNKLFIKEVTIGNDGRISFGLKAWIDSCKPIYYFR